MESKDTKNLLNFSKSPVLSPRLNILKHNSTFRSYLPVPNRSPVSSSPPRISSPSGLRLGIGFERNPSSLGQKPNSILEPSRRTLKPQRPIQPQQSTRPTVPNYSRVRAQAEDILRALNTDSITSSVCTPSNSPPTSTAVKRTFSTSSAPKNPLLTPSSTHSFYEDTFSDLASRDLLDEPLSAKKRRKVTFNDRISHLGDVGKPDYLGQTHFTKPSSLIERQKAFHARSSSADSYSQLHSTHQFLEDILKRQEVKFVEMINALEERVEEQAQQIRALQQENEKIKDLLR